MTLPFRIWLSPIFSRRSVEDFRLQVICPLNAPQIFVSPNASKAFVQQLEAKNWQESRNYSKLGFSDEFGVNHTCFERDISEEVFQQIGTSTTSTGSAFFEKCQLYAYSTGIVLMVSLYKLQTLSPRECRDAYNELVLLDPPGHVVKTNRYIHEQYSHLISSQQQVEHKTEVILKDCYTPGGIHWTHGVLSHVAKQSSKPLSAKELAEFSHGESLEEHDTTHGLLRARLGWEFTAFSTSDAEETTLVPALVFIIGYIWEIHWIISLNATKRLHEVQGHCHTDQRTLQLVRDFRRYAAILIASCHPTRLTMIERHFCLTRAIMKEWHLADLGHAINESTELLDLFHTHAQQERAEKRNWQFNIVLFMITAATLITGTKDAFEFIDKYGKHPIMRWLILVGPLTALILILVLWLSAWRPRRSKNT